MIEQIIQAQRAYFRSGATLDIRFRREMLKKLQARDLIREAGRSEAPGRPILYEVTEEFMNSFKLLSLDELPELPSFNEEVSDELLHYEENSSVD